MFTIRLATPSDAAQLALLSEQTFREAFAKDNSPDNIDLHVHKSYSAALQGSELLDPRRRIVMAWIGNHAIGYSHVFAGPVHPSVQSANPAELLRLYVVKEWYGRGLSNSLMETLIADGQDKGFRSMWLGVWERNVRAQVFYRRWSFIEVGSHVFMVGNDPQRDLIMVRDL